MSVGALKCAVSGTDHDRAAVCESSSNPRADRMSLGKRVGAGSRPGAACAECETEAVRD